MVERCEIRDGALDESGLLRCREQDSIWRIYINRLLLAWICSPQQPQGIPTSTGTHVAQFTVLRHGVVSRIAQWVLIKHFSIGNPLC